LHLTVRFRVAVKRRTEQAVDRATKRTLLQKKIDKPMLVLKAFIPADYD